MIHNHGYMQASASPRDHNGRRCASSKSPRSKTLAVVILIVQSLQGRVDGWGQGAMTPGLQEIWKENRERRRSLGVTKRHRDREAWPPAPPHLHTPLSHWTCNQQSKYKKWTCITSVNFKKFSAHGLGYRGRLFKSAWSLRARRSKWVDYGSEIRYGQGHVQS